MAYIDFGGFIGNMLVSRDEIFLRIYAAVALGFYSGDHGGKCWLPCACDAEFAAGHSLRHLDQQFNQRER